MSDEAATKLPRYLQAFQWDIKQRLVVIDQGGLLSNRPDFPQLLKLNNFSVGCFDPLKTVNETDELESQDCFQLIDDGALGTGKEGSLIHCQSAEMSGMLEPLNKILLPHNLRTDANVIKREPLETAKLDDIDDLPQVDWLAISKHFNPLPILESSKKKLQNILAIELQMPLFATHKQEALASQILPWMEAHGFQCYKFLNLGMQSHFTHEMKTVRPAATQLANIHALFVPNNERLVAMKKPKLLQLAFLMDTAYSAHDYAYRLLERIDSSMANDYLAAKGYLNLYEGQPVTFTLTPEYAPVPWDENNPPWEASAVPALA